jgi:methyl-accepting chemotaxis protein
MRFFKNVSIKQKLLRISLFTSGFALILSALSLTVNEGIEAKKSLLNELAIQTEIIGSNCAAALMFNDAKAATEILSALRANSSVDLALIYAKDGALFAQYSHDSKKSSIPHRLKKEGHLFGLNFLEVSHDIVFDNEVIGSVYIHSNLNELYVNLFRQAGVFLLVILLSFLAVYALSSGLQKTITVPISDLVRTMNTVSEKEDYSVRAEIQNKDELGALAEGFNEMLTQIQRRDSELEGYREKLQELVDMRTEQLKTANEQLQRELTMRKLADAEREKLIKELKSAFANIKTLSAMLPICASCKKIKDDKGYWKQVEVYITEHTDTLFSHGMCPECEKKAYAELEKFMKDKKVNSEDNKQQGQKKDGA